MTDRNKDSVRKTFKGSGNKLQVKLLSSAKKTGSTFYVRQKCVNF